jgi:hypothetical protein
MRNYAVASTYKHWTGTTPNDPAGKIEVVVGQVWQPFKSVEDAQAFIDRSDFPTPEMVFVVPINEIL